MTRVPRLQSSSRSDRPIDAEAPTLCDGCHRRPVQQGEPWVTFNIASGSPDALPGLPPAPAISHWSTSTRWCASAHKDKQGVPPVKAVFVLVQQGALRHSARKSRGISALSDPRTARLLGVAEVTCRCGSGRRWQAERDQDRKREAEQHQRRGARAMLSAGQIDAVTGFSYLSAVI